MPSAVAVAAATIATAPADGRGTLGRRARFDPAYGMFGHSAGFGWSMRIAAFDVPGGSA